MLPKMYELKELLKSNAKDLRETRQLHKNQSRDNLYNTDFDVFYNTLRSLQRKKYEYRHYHIAYSELRGCTRTQIENPAEDNLPNEKYISEIKSMYTDDAEALCINS